MCCGGQARQFRFLVHAHHIFVRYASCGSLYTGVSSSIATIDWQSKQLFRACRQLTILTHTLPHNPPPPRTHNTHDTVNTRHAP